MPPAFIFLTNIDTFVKIVFEVYGNRTSGAMRAMPSFQSSRSPDG